ncbi:hypothetical protein PCE1_000144 [Barthelona sp. PCE]
MSFHPALLNKYGLSTTCEDEESHSCSASFKQETISYERFKVPILNFNYTQPRVSPANFLLTLNPDFYPKRRDLRLLKEEEIAANGNPASYWEIDDVFMFPFHDVFRSVKFEAILVDPGTENLPDSTKKRFFDINFDGLLAQRSFLYFFHNDYNYLHNLFRKFGVRRVEMISFLSRNKQNQSDSLIKNGHFDCYLGIRGRINRIHDGDFIHSNMDSDVYVDNESERIPRMQSIVENFVISKHRLFVSLIPTRARPGWITIAPKITNKDNVEAVNPAV